MKKRVTYQESGRKKGKAGVEGEGWSSDKSFVMGPRKSNTKKGHSLNLLLKLVFRKGDGKAGEGVVAADEPKFNRKWVA